VVPPGEIVVVLGSDCESAPVPSSVPVTVRLNAPPGHDTCVGPLKVKVNFPLTQATPPASVTVDVTVVDCPKELTAPASRKMRARISFFMGALLKDEPLHTKFL
jgi:hypothetical protein